MGHNVVNNWLLMLLLVLYVVPILGISDVIGLHTIVENTMLEVQTIATHAHDAMLHSSLQTLLVIDCNCLPPGTLCRKSATSVLEFL